MEDDIIDAKQKNTFRKCLSFELPLLASIYIFYTLPLCIRLHCVFNLLLSLSLLYFLFPLETFYHSSCVVRVWTADVKKLPKFF